MASRFTRWSVALAAITGLVTLTSGASANAVGFCKFDNAGQIQGLQTNGNALVVNDIVNLTPFNQNNETGSVYLKTPLAFTSTTSFQTHFRFRHYPNTGAGGGSGFAFVLQNKATTALSGSGSSLGLNGVNPSVAVEFDTAQDNNDDPNANHVGIIQDGKTQQHLVTATPPFSMKNGTITDVWLDYDAATTTLRVFIGQGVPKPAAPLLTRVINIYAAVNALGNDNKVFVGFSGSTGNGTQNNQDISYWVLSNDGTPLSECVPCVGDGQCAAVPQTPACQPNGFCGECSAGNTTRCQPPLGQCDVLGGVCVECNSDAQCSGNTPVCLNKVCVACQSDFGGPAPACGAATTPACNATAPLQGACTECTNANAARCTGTKPVCLSSVGTCGCAADADCGGAGSGFICEGAPGSCVPGCRPNGVGGTCPGAQQCATTPGGNNTGTCVTGCADDTGCPNPLAPKCFNGGAAGICVQCLGNPDCPANQFCTPQNTCGDCIPGGAGNCDINGPGSVCRPNGQCGCTTDTDCGGLNSGRVCDDSLKVCRVGCRGIGGNRCPIGDRCTSISAAIGTCVTDPGDGGADGGDGGRTDGGDGGSTLDGSAGDSGFNDGGYGGGDGSADSGVLDEFNVQGAGCNCGVFGSGGMGQWGALGVSAMAIAAFVRRRRKA